jgi:hypothetical protein
LRRLDPFHVLRKEPQCFSQILEIGILKILM